MNDLDHLTALRSKLRSPVLNLYAINDRSQTTLCMVTAHGSEDAIRFCEDAGLAWELGNTVTRRVQRNVGGTVGVLAAVPMNDSKNFRVRARSSTGSEHRNSTPGVEGSNPSALTKPE